MKKVKFRVAYSLEKMETRDSYTKILCQGITETI